MSNIKDICRKDIKNMLMQITGNCNMNQESIIASIYNKLDNLSTIDNYAIREFIKNEINNINKQDSVVSEEITIPSKTYTTGKTSDPNKTAIYVKSDDNDPVLLEIVDTNSVQQKLESYKSQNESVTSSVLVSDDETQENENENVEVKETEQNVENTEMQSDENNTDNNLEKIETALDNADNILRVINDNIDIIPDMDTITQLITIQLGIENKKEELESTDTNDETIGTKIESLNRLLDGVDTKVMDLINKSIPGEENKNPAKDADDYLDSIINDEEETDNEDVSSSKKPNKYASKGLISDLSDDEEEDEESDDDELEIDDKIEFLREESEDEEFDDEEFDDEESEDEDEEIDLEEETNDIKDLVQKLADLANDEDADEDEINDIKEQLDEKLDNLNSLSDNEESEDEDEETDEESNDEEEDEESDDDELSGFDDEFIDDFDLDFSDLDEEETDEESEDEAITSDLEEESEDEELEIEEESEEDEESDDDEEIEDKVDNLEDKVDNLEDKVDEIIDKVDDGESLSDNEESEDEELEIEEESEEDEESDDDEEIEDKDKKDKKDKKSKDDNLFDAEQVLSNAKATLSSKKVKNKRNKK